METEAKLAAPWNKSRLRESGSVRPIATGAGDVLPAQAEI